MHTICACICIVLSNLWSRSFLISWYRLIRPDRATMECNKSRESRKGYARRRGGRKEEKREFRRLKNSKGEEPPAWPRFSVADVEDTMSVVEQETSLALENFYGGKSEMLCSSFLSLPVDRGERERECALFSLA